MGSSELCDVSLSILSGLFYNHDICILSGTCYISCLISGQRHQIDLGCIISRSMFVCSYQMSGFFRIGLKLLISLDFSLCLLPWKALVVFTASLSHPRPRRSKWGQPAASAPGLGFCCFCILCIVICKPLLARNPQSCQNERRSQKGKAKGRMHFNVFKLCWGHLACGDLLRRGWIVMQTQEGWGSFNDKCQVYRKCIVYKSQWNKNRIIKPFWDLPDASKCFREIHYIWRIFPGGILCVLNIFHCNK